MAKKFGKFLLFTAAVGSAAAAVYYYIQKKDILGNSSEDADYDDFSEDTDNSAEASRNYVPLNSDAKPEAAGETKAEDTPADKSNSFTPLSQQVEKVAEKTDETVEEFFDEEDEADTPSGN